MRLQNYDEITACHTQEGRYGCTPDTSELENVHAGRCQTCLEIRPRERRTGTFSSSDVMESDTFPVYGIKRPRSEYIRAFGRLALHGGKARKSTVIEGLVKDSNIMTWAGVRQIRGVRQSAAGCAPFLIRRRRGGARSPSRHMGVGARCRLPSRARRRLRYSGSDEDTVRGGVPLLPFLHLPAHPPQPKKKITACVVFTCRDIQHPRMF